MTKACDLSGKKVQFGNNVSKANNKTRRKFNVNLQSVTFKSDILNKNISCLLYTSPSPRDLSTSRMPSSA